MWRRKFSVVVFVSVKAESNRIRKGLCAPLTYLFYILILLIYNNLHGFPSFPAFQFWLLRTQMTCGITLPHPGFARLFSPGVLSFVPLFLEQPQTGC